MTIVSESKKTVHPILPSYTVSYIKTSLSGALQAVAFFIAGFSIFCAPLGDACHCPFQEPVKTVFSVGERL